MSAKIQNKKEPDLFEQLQGADANIRKKTRFTLPHLKKSMELSYENVIFIMVAFIMSCVVAFSLGVEKGRRDREKSRMREVTVKIEDLAAKETPRAHKAKSEYVILLASFANPDSAKAEAGKLERDGYGAKIKKSGRYYQVFMGGFNDRRRAETALGRLRERYDDAYIKKITEGD